MKLTRFACTVFTPLALWINGATASITSPVTIDFGNFNASAWYGKTNLPLGHASGQACEGEFECYSEDGMAIGTVYVDGTPGAHIHRAITDGSKKVQYHADSGGIYGRAEDFTRFSLDSFFADTRYSSEDARYPIPGTDPQEYEPVKKIWVVGIRGEETLVHSFENTGTTVQTVTLTEDFFRNIDAFHIHFEGYPTMPSGALNQTSFELKVDNINVSAAVVPLPASIYFLATGLIGIFRLARNNVSVTA